MESGEIGIIIAILLAAGSLIWQLRVQANRLDDKIETEADRLETQIKSVDDRLDRKIETEADRLETQIKSVDDRLQIQIKSLDDRTWDAALEAARNEGRYEVLVAQTHTHESNESAAAD